MSMFRDEIARQARPEQRAEMGGWRRWARPKPTPAPQPQLGLFDQRHTDKGSNFAPPRSSAEADS
jgi:hypothetical protein